MARRTSKATANQISADEMRRITYNLVMKNVQHVGDKSFSTVPLELLYIDESYQRNETVSPAKINRLVANWNQDKMDALKVVPHTESLRFSIVNGYHRYAAMKIKGIESAICELLTDVGKLEPEMRQKQEATLFATQEDEVEKLYPVQKHKANLVRGVKENVELQELIDKYQFTLKTTGTGGHSRRGQLSGFAEALKICKRSGKAHLDLIFKILCDARWNLSVDGLSITALRMVDGVLRLHPEDSERERIIRKATNALEKLEPDQFYAGAREMYPGRKVTERNTMYLEQLTKPIPMGAVLYDPEKEETYVKA